MSEIYSLSWESCLAYVAFIEGNFPQCGPRYIVVFGGTIPLLVRIMWALPMHYPGHFPHCTQEIIMDFFYRKSIINCYLFPCYLPNLYLCIFPNPIPTPLLGYLPTQIRYNLICLFKNNNGFSIETPLLYREYIVGNDLGNAWEVPTLFRLEVLLSHQRQLYIVFRIVGSFPQ